MADRYWVGGNGTWDGTIGTKWSATSGGAGGASIPTASDNVFINTAASITVTVVGTRTCLNLDFTGYTGSLTGSSSPIISVSGTVITFSTGMSFNVAGPTINIVTASTVALTTNGKTLRSLGVITAGCSLTLSENLSLSGLLTVSAGTFDANDFDVAIGAFSSTGTTTRVINMGNGDWTITSSQVALWDMTTVTNATLNAEGSTLTINLGITGANTFVAGLKVNSPITLTARTVSNARFNPSGSGGIASLTVIGPNTLDVAGSIPIDNASLLGTGEGQIFVASSGIGSARTITVSGAITGQYVGVRDCTKAGAGTIEFAPGWNMGNVTGVVLTPRTSRLQNVMGI